MEEKVKSTAQDEVVCESVEETFNPYNSAKIGQTTPNVVAKELINANKEGSNKVLDMYKDSQISVNTSHDKIIDGYVKLADDSNATFQERMEALNKASKEQEKKDQSNTYYRQDAESNRTADRNWGWGVLIAVILGASGVTLAYNYSK